MQLTADGYLMVEGRDKDLINRGGEKIAAEEVENLLLSHPAVADIALVAMPDAFLGERTCAFVIARGQAPRAVELLRHLRAQGLAAFKLPDRFEFIPAFPQTGVGKVSRKDLRDAVEAEGGTVTLIAKERGKAEAQLAGSPSVLFDAVALVISADDADLIA